MQDFYVRGWGGFFVDEESGCFLSSGLGGVVD